MRVLIAGGTGFIGRALQKALAGNEIVLMSRDRKNGLSWQDPWQEELNRIDAVINLSGAPVTAKWSEANRAEILDSRVKPTQWIAEAIAQCSNPPKVWVNASAIGFYGDRKDEWVDEKSPAGSGFLPDVCQQWESALFGCKLPKTRQVAMRIGVVLGQGGGAFDPLLKLTRAYLGGSIGTGRQWMSWIHLDDLAALFMFALRNEVNGPMNGVSPSPSTNAELMATLRHSVGRPWAPPAPALALKVLGKVAGPDAHVLLDSQRVRPSVALDLGFRWRFHQLDEAVRALLYG